MKDYKQIEEVLLWRNHNIQYNALLKNIDFLKNAQTGERVPVDDGILFGPYSNGLNTVQFAHAIAELIENFEKLASFTEER